MQSIDTLQPSEMKGDFKGKKYFYFFSVRWRFLRCNNGVMTLSRCGSQNPKAKPQNGLPPGFKVHS